jgi:hypothetical protein
MALTSGALKTRACALGTCKPSCTGKLARLFFMSEIHGPQGTAGRMAAPEPSRFGCRVWSHRTRGGARALPSREVGSRATVHVVAIEPS